MQFTDLLIDGHVHLHQSFDLVEFFDQSCANFETAAQDDSIGQGWAGCLFCSATRRQPLDQLIDRLAASDIPNLECVDLDHSLAWSYARLNDGRCVCLILGEQLVTSDNLEVLIYGIKKPIDHGHSTSATIAAGLENDGVVILPWGFGKWMFKRGKLVKELIESNHPMANGGPRLFVGDNGGRAGWSRPPALIRAATNLGIWNLPGSDPLPLAGEIAKPGSSGFLLNGQFSLNALLANIRAALNNLESQPSIFGKPEQLLRFARNQIRLRL